VVGIEVRDPGQESAEGNIVSPVVSSGCRPAKEVVGKLCFWVAERFSAAINICFFISGF